MATALSSAKSRASRRRREDAVIARGAAALLLRLRREGRIENPRAAEEYLRLRLAGLAQEELHALWLDGRRRIITCDVLAKRPEVLLPGSESAPSSQRGGSGGIRSMIARARSSAACHAASSRTHAFSLPQA